MVSPENQIWRFLAHLHRRQVLVILLLWCSVGYLVFILTVHKNEITVPHTKNSDHTTRPEHRAAILNTKNSHPLKIPLPSQSFTAKKLDENADVSVDRTPPLTEAEILKKFMKKSYSLPRESWTTANPLMAYAERDGCTSIPSVYDIEFNNMYWQRVTARNATFYVFSAYYDDRPQVGEVPVVRILSFIDRLSPPRILCQFRYIYPTSEGDETRTYFASVSYTHVWREKWGNHKDGILQPFLITCKLRAKDKGIVPSSVSLVEHKCDFPRNILKVVNKKPAKKGRFAVCVKYLDFPFEDISARLVEWIELLNILGAEKFFLYDLDVHPNISKVLGYYVNSGLVELTPFSLPGNQPNIPGLRHAYLESQLVYKRQNEILPYNDCLYRNLNAYDYLAVLDLDEVIMPLEHRTWNELIEAALVLASEEANYTRAVFDFRNIYFLDDLGDVKDGHHHHHEEGIPKYLHMLQHVYRTDFYHRRGYFAKCFHNTQLIVALHNHFPLECFETCLSYSVNISLAQLQHYRKECVDVDKCDAYRSYTVRDTAIWRHKDELIRRTTKVLSDLKFINYENS